MSKHRQSLGHKAAIHKLKTSEKKVLDECTSQQHNNQNIKTEKIFRTAYYLARQGRPFTALPSCVDLQVLNGVDMGWVPQSQMTCAKITLHIATEMRSKLCKKRND